MGPRVRRDGARGPTATCRCWIAGLRLKRGAFPDDPRHQDMERDADVISVAFAMENLYVAARAMGLGTAPTVFHWFVEDEFNALLGIGPR